MGATASEASQDLSSQRAADSDRRGAGHRPTPRFLAELRSHQEWCFSRPQFPLWPRRRTKGCHFQEPLASQSPEPESGMLTLCVPASGAMGPCAGRAEAQGDARSGGQSCVDWLAACQALDPPQPPNPVPSAPPVIGHCRLLPAAKEAGHSFRKGSCRLGLAVGQHQSARCPSNPGLWALWGEGPGGGRWRVRRQRSPWPVSVPEAGHLPARMRVRRGCPLPRAESQAPPGPLPQRPALPLLSLPLRNP